MNGINVPSQLRHELRRPRMTREYAEACIRDYVIARPNVPISYDMFSSALDGRSAANHIPRLLKSRKLTRRSAKNGTKGYAYVYEWHNDPKPIPSHKIKSEHGEVVTVMREYATGIQLKRLDEWFMDFCNDQTDIEGANRFRKYIHDRANTENSK